MNSLGFWGVPPIINSDPATASSSSGIWSGISNAIAKLGTPIPATPTTTSLATPAPTSLFSQRIFGLPLPLVVAGGVVGYIVWKRRKKK